MRRATGVERSGHATPRLVIGAAARALGWALAAVVAPAIVGAQVASIGSPRIAIYSDQHDGTSMRIVGHGFGTPDPNSFVQVKRDVYGAYWRKTDSTDPRIKIWRDDLIVFEHYIQVTSGDVRVKTPAGYSAVVPIDEVYRYDWDDIPLTPGTNASPLAIALDPAHGSAWINQEFHLDLQKVSMASGAAQAVAIPKPPAPGPFAFIAPPDIRTQISVLGEDVELDPAGRVWFTQGGASLYLGVHPNHSRVVRYDPYTIYTNFRVYNVVGDGNEVIGVTYDAANDRAWFSSRRTGSAPAKLTSFVVGTMPFDNDFDFSTSLDHMLCPTGGPYTGCYREYPLPDSVEIPAHVAVDATGRVWYSNFWKAGQTATNHIGRLDPATGAVAVFPLPVQTNASYPLNVVGSAPWEITIAPNGDVIFNECFDGTLSVLRSGLIGGPANCYALDFTLDPVHGRNPCIDEIDVPDFALGTQLVHSVTLAPDGNAWFTIGGPDPDGTNSLGYVTADWTSIVRLPSLSIFPGPEALWGVFSGDEPFDGAGVKVDPTTGDVWFADFERKRVGRLHRTL